VAAGQTNQHRLAIATLVIAVLIGTQGCATRQDAHTISPLSLEEAKGEAQSTEDDIVAQIPSDSVAHVEQAPTGGLLSCTSESAYQWYGHTYVDFRSGVDAESIVDDLVDKWKADKSFSVSTYTNLSDTRVVRLRGDYKSSYFVNVAEAGSQISIASFSPCFFLPKGADPGGEF
jgi:hypothetical protein